MSSHNYCVITKRIGWLKSPEACQVHQCFNACFVLQPLHGGSEHNTVLNRMVADKAQDLVQKLRSTEGYTADN